MIPYYGDFAEDATVYIAFNTFSSDGPSASVTITALADGDIKVHKDGSATEIVTDGATVSINFDSITGNHLVTIDTSAHSDYSTGSDYHVRMEGTDIDGGTVNAWIGHFSIENRFKEVTVTSMAADVISATTIADDSITTDQFADGTITAAKIAGDAITEAKIADNALANEHFADAALTSTEITSVGGVPTTAEFNARVDRNADLIESQRGSHTWQGNVYYVAPDNGNDSTGDGSRALPYATIQAAHDDLVTDSNHDVIMLVADAAAGATTHTVAAKTTISKRYCFIRGAGRDFIITRSGNGDTMEITADGVELSGFQITRPVGGTGNAVQITDADFTRIHNLWFNATRADALNILRGENCQIHDNTFTASGQAAASAGIHIDGTSGSSGNNVICNNIFRDTVGDGIKIENGTTDNTTIKGNIIEDSTLYGINIGASSANTMVLDNRLGENASGNITDGGTDTTQYNNTPAGGGDATEAKQDTIITSIGTIPVLDGGAQTIGAAIAKLADDNGGADYDAGTDSLQEIRDHIADGTNLTEAGGDGDHLTAINLPNQTMDIVGDITGDLSGSVGTVTGAVGSVAGHTPQTADHTANIALILGDTAELQTDDVPGLIAALNNISAADVLTQVNAALNTAIAELGVAPPTATPTMRTGLMLLYMSLRNKLDITATTKKVHNNSGTKICEKALSDAAGTYSEGEMA